MRPIARVLWGFLLVFFDLRFDGFDMVPDVLGWMLMLAGLTPLTALDRWFRAAVGAAVLAALLSLPQQFSEPSGGLATASAVLETAVVFSILSGILAVIGEHPARRRVDVLRWLDLALVLALFAGAAAVGFRTVETIWAVPLAIVGLGIFVWFLVTLASLRDHPRLGGSVANA